MKQTCPYLEQCKVPKETHRCFDDLKYVQCTIYKRYQNMGDVKNDDLAPEVEARGIEYKLLIKKYGIIESNETNEDEEVNENTIIYNLPNIPNIPYISLAEFNVST